MGGLGRPSLFSQDAIDILKLSNLSAIPFIHPGGVTQSPGTNIAYRNSANLISSRKYAPWMLKSSFTILDFF